MVSSALALLIAHSTVYPFAFPMLAEAVSAAVGIVSLLPLAGNVKVLLDVVNVKFLGCIVISFVTDLPFNVAVTVAVLFPSLLELLDLLITITAFLLSWESGVKVISPFVLFVVHVISSSVFKAFVLPPLLAVNSILSPSTYCKFERNGLKSMSFNSDSVGVGVVSCFNIIMFLVLPVSPLSTFAVTTISLSLVSAFNAFIVATWLEFLLTVMLTYSLFASATVQTTFSPVFNTPLFTFAVNIT